MGNSFSTDSGPKQSILVKPDGDVRVTDVESCPVSPETREAWLRQVKSAPSASPDPPQGLSGGAKSAAAAVTAPSAQSCDSSRIDQSRTGSPAPEALAQVSKGQRGLAGRETKLGVERQISSIPRALPPHIAPEPSTKSSLTAVVSRSSNGGETFSADATPRTGNPHDERWIYPSESQFFSALVRKSHTPKASDMRNVVPLHNAVNEQTWALILGWEAPYGLAAPSDGAKGDVKGSGKSVQAPSTPPSSTPRLLSFSGDYSKLTPKARFRTLLGYQRPFDRHDWVIDRAGTQVDYVIDFYEGKADNPDNNRTVNFYLDVRPKLNSFEGCRMRFARFWGLEGWV